jgi:hypothetical protein
LQSINNLKLERKTFNNYFLIFLVKISYLFIPSIKTKYNQTSIASSSPSTEALQTKEKKRYSKKIEQKKTEVCFSFIRRCAR